MRASRNERSTPRQLKSLSKNENLPGETSWSGQKGNINMAGITQSERSLRIFRTCLESGYRSTKRAVARF
jgi:hypothetical protein